jgi:hypothetical protein
MQDHENEIREYERKKRNPCGMSNKKCCMIGISVPLIIITGVIFILAFTLSVYYTEDDCGQIYEWGPYFEDSREKIIEWGGSDLMLEAYDKAKDAG